MKNVSSLVKVKAVTRPILDIELLMKLNVFRRCTRMAKWQINIGLKL